MYRMKLQCYYINIILTCHINGHVREFIKVGGAEHLDDNVAYSIESIFISNTVLPR